MRFLLTLALMLGGSHAHAVDTLSHEQAVEMAMSADHRIKEREHLVEAARALIDEARGSDDLIIDTNLFVGMAPAVEGGLYEDGSEDCGVTSTCNPRGDLYDIGGLMPWTNLQFSIIKPLNTLGKIESYEQAAQGNVSIKQQDVRLQSAQTYLDVSKAYYGLLAAQDTRKLLADVEKRLTSALDLVNHWIEDGSGDVRQSDQFAIEAGLALIKAYRAQAEAVENVAQAGLKMLVGWESDEPIQAAERWLKPLPLPQESLEDLQKRALELRPEMAQVEAGMKARKALVDAKAAERRPNIYAGLVGGAAYTPNREALNNPHIYDPFNYMAASPVIGIKWDYAVGAQDARVAQAQAEMDAMLETAAFARQGIPFQVAESYHTLQGGYTTTQHLANGSRNARRWMIASYADFEAGLESAETVMTAFQAYVLAHSEYVQAVFDYNMQIANLTVVTGDY